MATPAEKIVVIGGGITGAFASYFAARDGAEVVLVERDGIARHASGNNPGGLNPLFGSGIPGPLDELALQAYELHLDCWESIRSLSGIAFEARPKTRLNLAFEDVDLETLGAMKKNYDRYPNFDARWLEDTEMRSMEPRIAKSVIAGLLAGGDAHVGSKGYTEAVARAAQKLGVRLIEAEVTGLETDGDRVSVVVCGSDKLPCDGVVIATGPWCEEPSRWLGVKLPVSPLKGEMVLVEPDGGGISTDIAWRDAAAYQAPNEQVWLGGNEEQAGFDENITDGARDLILERMERVIPELGRGRVVRQY
ncbi:MAG TPA: FAD-dependent oxidoreductase, partial [Actinomycetota bacterium]|nr:FAD-dependent oxidoreductase [Actinomycetota bacterium]